ncbi:MAG: hypothetical protein AAGI24_15045 [Pseudomonadota bacterium]
MPQVTLAFAAALIVLGLFSWIAAGQSSITALIPAFFGLGLAVAGFIALKESLRKHAMHLAAVVALLGAIGALMRGIPGILAADGDLRLATVSQLVMGVAMIVFLVLCVRSFIAARKAREVDA